MLDDVFNPFPKKSTCAAATENTRVRLEFHIGEVTPLSNP